MLSDLQLVYMVPRNSTQLLNINTTKFQVEREPVYDSVILVFLTVVKRAFNIIIQVVMEFITPNKVSLKLLYQSFSYVNQKDLVDNRFVYVDAALTVHAKRGSISLTMK